MRSARGGAATLRAVLDRPKLWRVTAALSALLLCAVLLACAQGSLTILTQRPTSAGSGAATQPTWERWCTSGRPRQDRTRLAFCARVQGRVLDSTAGPAPGEAHLALLSDFHIVIVRLPDFTARPGTGAEVLAIGPLFRARDGQREVQAFRFKRL
ncbi:MAG TPA: hypothetical protein VGL57_11030 [Solirubrobacteraceae bacterium]